VDILSRPIGHGFAVFFPVAAFPFRGGVALSIDGSARRVPVQKPDDFPTVARSDDESQIGEFVKNGGPDGSVSIGSAVEVVR
jgi:hypothetical protein